MGDLTKNISRHECECRCGCGFDTIDYKLVDTIQTAADLLVVEHEADYAVVNITGPNRCHSRNEEEGGSSKSQHLKGRALDHRIDLVFGQQKERVPTDELASIYEELEPDFGIGKYPLGRIHLDSRTNGPARWDVR